MTQDIEVSAHKGMDQLAVDYEKARTVYREAVNACSQADAGRIAALKRLDELQKEIDEWYKRQRQDAPTSSQWGETWGEVDDDK